MTKKYPIVLLILLSVFGFTNSNAQNNFFNDVKESNFITNDQERKIVPEKYRTVVMDLNSMKTFLSALPNNMDNVAARNLTPVISIPMPDGSTSQFHMWERSIMEPALEAKFPLIKTYLGQGITNKTDVLVADMTEFGFHAMIISPKGNVFIDPYDFTTLTNYISYYKKDFKKNIPFVEEAIVRTEGETNTPDAPPTGQCVGATLRTYRLAVGCNTYYAKAATGLTSPSKAQAMAKIVISVNRVVGVYETEVAVRMVLVGNNDNIVFVTQSGDPYYSANNNGGTLLGINQTQCDNLIGTANYDIGHVFSTGGGGVAGLGVVCINGQKAKGVTGSSQPYGDPFDIDYVAHEIGHQFKGNHTFNTDDADCGPQANATGSGSTNCEPGSGTTIMAYAGICPTDDLAANSQPQFHAVSQAEIMNYTINGNGNFCAVTTATANNSPVVTAGINYTIPISTPFVLTGTATDINGDALTYSWEQMNTGAAKGNSTSGTEGAQTPLFRSFLPQTHGTRYFPKLSDVINNFPTKGERLSTITRSLNFRLTVRDNVAGGGGVCFGDVVISVNSTGAPFAVTYPNNWGELWYEGQSKIVTWDKGSTETTPFNVANVEIALSTDEGLTYPIILKANTPNDGTESIVVPANFTNQARIRVRALGNVFYDISNNNFTISPNPVPVKWLSFTGEKLKNNTVKLNWEVNEIDNHFYVVERSLDGEKFSTIGEVASSTAAGNNHSYSFIDSRPFASKNFYRIKQVDKNGSYSYSNIVIITMDESFGSWVVYPNPTNEKVNLYSNANYNNLKVSVYDAIGKVILTQTKAAVNKGEVITVSLAGLSKGIYSIQVSANNAETMTKKVVLQ